MLKNWTKIFLYQIKHNKLFTALNILGLALGIAGLVFAILYWNDEHSYNDWNPEKEKVYQSVSELGENMVWATSVYPLAKYMKNDIPEIEDFCYLNNWYYDEIVHYGNKAEKIKILDAQPNFFSFFPFEFTRGSIKSALPDEWSIALSQETAQKLFGNEEAMGKEVLYSGRRLIVRSVYKIPGKSSMAPQAVTNLLYSTRLKGNEDQWGNFNFGLLLKLKDPSKAAVVKKKLENLYMEYRTKPAAKESGLSVDEYIKQNGKVTVILEQLAQARLHSVTEGYPEGRGNYQFLLIMTGLSILIVILSIVNYVNLATANAIKRAKEIGVRKILGAGKANIIGQFIFETVIMASAALLLALVIVELALPYYNDLLAKALVINGSQFYMQLALIFIIIIIVAGIFPAVYVSNFEMLKVLRGNFGASKSGVWLRNGMLILQFGIAAFFIIGSYIVNQQVHYMMNKDLGLNGDQVIEIFYRKLDQSSPQVIYNRYDAIKQEIKKMKGVQAVSGGAFSLGSDRGSASGFYYREKDISSKNMAVDFDFLEMMQIKTIQGRALSEKFASDTASNMMVNETTMKLMNEKNAVGKEVDWNGKNLKVVGVVKDFHLSGLQNEIPPMVFFHFKTIDWMSYNLDRVYVKIAPQDMEKTIAALDKFWVTSVDPEYPFSYEFVNKNYARTYEAYVKQRNLFSLLNVVVIVIALFGLFALASFSIQRRMKEIAIRKTLGAETGTLLRELSKQYIIFCIIGFAIAFVPAWLLLDKWLENFAYRIPLSIVPFIIGLAVLLVLTLAVVLGRAYRATRVHVLTYLKYE